MEYLDFELEIGPGAGRKYSVAVLRSPAGETRESMHFPFDELELESHLDKVQIALLRSGGTRRRVPIPEQQAVQDFGLRLFDTLFIGEVRSLYNESQREAARRGIGLRLKLRIQPPELAALPWEFLYDPREDDFICLSSNNPLVRYLEVPQPLQSFTVDLPLRILGMIAAPHDLTPLDIPREKERVERAVSRLAIQGLVELTWLEGQTWRDLQRALLGGPWHVFHFIGHGGFDRNTDEGLLALADEEGLTRHITATQLGRLLDDHSPLRLVVLNSCEGALGSKRDVFSSTASILVRRGIPAVIAMQYEITDRAAIEFSRAFYEALAFGMPVDAAVAEARKAISLAINNTVEWGTPVLFLRAPDGLIFEVSGREGLQRAAELPAAPTGDDLEPRLNELFTQGLGEFFNEQWEAAARTFQAIVDLRPEYEDAAEKLEISTRNARHNALYQTGQDAMEKGDWAQAIEALQVLKDEDTQLPGVELLLEDASKHLELASLADTASRLFAAENWDAVVKVFERINTLEPEFGDPEGLLEQAIARQADQQRQERLSQLFSQAVREMNASRWEAAAELLREVVGLQADYPNAAGLLSKAEGEIRSRKEALQELYTQAAQAIQAADWQEARKKLNALLERETGFKDADELLDRVENELNRLAEEDRQRRDQIATLYQFAIQMVADEQWPKAQELLEEIRGLDPDFDDPEGLAEQARVELEREAQRQEELRKRLDGLYGEAVRALERGQPQQALEKWRQVQAIDAGYPDSQQVTGRARQLQSRREQAARRYQQAIEAAGSENWGAAEEHMAAIHNLDPQFSDVEGVRARTRRGLEAKKAREREEQAALEEEYQAALAQLQAGEPEAALAAWQALASRNPEFPDRAGLVRNAEQELKRRTRAKRWGFLSVEELGKRLPGGRSLWIGLPIVILSIAIGAYLYFQPSGATTPDTPETPRLTSPPAENEGFPESAPDQVLACEDELGCLVLPPSDPIRIGALLALSGPVQGYGDDSRRAIELALDDRNRILLNHAIELVFIDAGCDEEGGRLAAEQISADPQIAGVIGATCSDGSRAAIPVISAAGLVMISPSSTAPSLTNPNLDWNPGFYRTAQNDLFQGPVAAEFAYTVLGARTAATVYDDSLYSTGLQETFVERFRQLGGQILAQTKVAVDSNDFGSALANLNLARLNQNSLDVIFFPLLTGPGSEFINQVKNTPGLAGSTLLSADGLMAETTLQTAGPNAAGLYLSGPHLSSSGYSLLISKWRSVYKSDPQTAYAAHAYDATTLLLHAIDRVAVRGQDGTLSIGRQSLRDALFGIQDFGGTVGRLTCGVYGDCGTDQSLAVFQITPEDINRNTLPSDPVWGP